MIRVVIYSEDRKLQPLLSSALGKEFEIVLESREDGMDRILSSAACDVIVVDLDPGRESLRECIAYSRRIVASDVPAVVMAHDTLRATAVELVRLGAHGYCRKPPSIRDLKTLLRMAHEISTSQRQGNTGQQHLGPPDSCDRMIGSSPRMQQVYDLVRRVSSLTASVLITGESGTGKELIASAIHNLGTRSSRPFVAVCCGAIPETLIEAELFGHEKGAFTGSVGMREGYFEQAGDGTLFLDEIGELSLYTQVKLLRALQQREFSRLGGNRTIALRARVVLATHRNLDEMVAQGKFRQDLYYRINVMKIGAPALREHAEDIPQIASHFLRCYSEMYQKSIHTIEPEALALLQSYSWPGNVRELENIIQRAIILASGDSICAEDVSLNPDLPLPLHEDAAVDSIRGGPSSSFEQLLREYKIKLAMTAVKDNNGNKTLAARRLQISRAYLHRLIRLAELGELGEFMESERDAIEAA